MENGSNGGRAGVGFIGALQITFIVLKLCGVISWGWACVLMPTIIEIVLFLVIVLIYAIADK